MTRSLVGARHTVLAVVGTVLALSLSSTGPAVAAPEAAAVPEGAITVEVLAVNGSGCKAGEAFVYTQPDKTGFRIRYRDFTAEAGGGAVASDRRKNCQAGVQINVPQGWTLGIAQADYRGRARLLSGATAIHHTNYYWQGSSENNPTDDTFTGPFSGFWQDNDATPVVVFKPCSEQRVLNINTTLRVDPGTSTGRSSITMTSSDGDADTLFNFSWRRC